MPEEARQHFQQCIRTLEEILAGVRERKEHHEIIADLGYTISFLGANKRGFIEILDKGVKEQRVGQFMAWLNKKGKDIHSAWEAASFILYNRNVWQSLEPYQKAVVLLFTAMKKNFGPVVLDVFREQGAYFQKLGLGNDAFRAIRENIEIGGPVVNGSRKQVFDAIEDEGLEMIGLTEAGIKMAEFLISAEAEEILAMNQG